MQKTLILATIALIGSVTARISDGICDNVHLQENFDATKYTGAWFNVAKD